MGHLNMLCMTGSSMSQIAYRMRSSDYFANKNEDEVRNLKQELAQEKVYNKNLGEQRSHLIKKLERISNFSKRKEETE